MSESGHESNHGPWIDAIMLLTVSILVGTLWVAVPVETPEPTPQTEVGPSLQARRVHVAALRDSLAALESEAAAERAFERAEERERTRHATEIDRLQARVRELDARIAQLGGALADSRRPDAAGLVGTPTAALTEKKPVVFVLRGNRVLVYGDDTYSQERLRTESGGSVTVATPKSEGETLADARRPGSVFLRALEAMDPEEQFAALVVAADSFEGFRALRGLARERRISVGWEPHLREDGLLLFGSSGREMRVLEPKRRGGN